MTALLQDAEVEAERLAHMRDTALGRLQVASSLRTDLETTIVGAIRCAHRAGASVRTLSVESGLPEKDVRRVVKGGRL